MSYGKLVDWLFICAVALWLCSCPARTQPATAPGDSGKATLLQVCVWTPLQVFPKHYDVRGLRLSLFGGVNRAVSGLDIAAGWAIAERECTGLQVAVMGAGTNSDFAGIQVSAGAEMLLYFLSETLAPKALDRSLPVSCRCLGSMSGLQFGAIGCESGEELRGMQVSGLVSRTAATAGLQIAGVVSNTQRLHGVQITGVAATATAMTGLQLSGLLNRSRVATGLQIGLVNVAEELHGMQIGLVNVSRNHRVPFLPLINARF